MAQSQDGTQWLEKDKLDWSDFSGKVDVKSKHHAMTASGIFINMQQVEGDSIEIKLIANFYPQRSWLKRGKDNDHLLNHEQRHFDIAELFRRKLMKKIMDSKSLKSSKLTDVLDRLYNQNDEALRSYQSRYDLKTEHSKKVEQQKIWDLKIEKELAELDQYKHSSYRFAISEMRLSKTSSRNKDSSKRRKSKRRRG